MKNFSVVLMMVCLLAPPALANADDSLEARFAAYEQVRAGDVEGALATARSIEGSPSLQVEVLVDVAGLGASARVEEVGDVEGAKEILHLALAATRRIEDADRRSELLFDLGLSIEDIATAQAEAGDIESALFWIRFLDEIGDDGYLRSRALATIATTQARAGDVEGALATARSIEGPPSLQVEVLVDVAGLGASARVNAGDIEGARETLDLALAATRRIEDTDPRAFISLGQPIEDIATAQAEAGDVESAFFWIRVLDEIGPWPALIPFGPRSSYENRYRVLMAIAAAQARAGDVEGAGETLDLALAAARLVPDLVSDAVVPCRGQSSVKLRARPPLRLLFCRDRSNVPSARAVSAVALAQAKVGDAEGALATAKSIGNSQVRAETLGQLVALQPSRTGQ